MKLIGQAQTQIADLRSASDGVRTSHRSSDRGRLDNALQSLEKKRASKLAAAAKALDECEYLWSAGRVEAAYVACDRAKKDIGAAEATDELAKDLGR